MHFSNYICYNNSNDFIIVIMYYIVFWLYFWNIRSRKYNIVFVKSITSIVWDTTRFFKKSYDVGTYLVFIILDVNSIFIV